MRTLLLFVMAIHLTFCVTAQDEQPIEYSPQLLTNVNSTFKTILRKKSEKKAGDFYKRVNSELTQMARKGWYAVQFERLTTEDGKNTRGFILLLNRNVQRVRNMRLPKKKTN